MLSHMSSMRKILPVLLCLAMLAGGAALYAQMPVRRLQRRRLQRRRLLRSGCGSRSRTAEDRYGDTAWVLVSTALVWP